MHQLHITLQGKGGVGKSYISSLLAQCYIKQGSTPLCIDTDPVNATLQGYAALDTQHINIVENNAVNSRRFDDMIETILDEKRDVIIDNGASSFLPLSHYLLENNAFELLRNAGRHITVHTVVTGGQALTDTIGGFAMLAEQLPEHVRLVVWLNEFFGAIEAEDKQFTEMRAYKKHADRIFAIIRLEQRTAETFGKDIETMLHQKKTFAEMREDTSCTLMAKQRLSMTEKAIFDQLEPLLHAA